MSLNLVKALLILNANPRGCNQYKPCSVTGKSAAKGKAKPHKTTKAVKTEKVPKKVGKSTPVKSTKGASGPTSASNLQSNFEKSSGLKGVKFTTDGMGSSKSAYGDAKLSKAAEKHAKTAGFREIKGPTLSSKATHRWFVDPHGNKMAIMTPNKGEPGKHSVSFTESNKHYLAEVKKAKAARGSK